ncbi:WAP four-disulfide core domain protein 3 [Manacus vitellinus]|uniref:WAP four-disulfide core domain protein 3 n=1 Tax=Manacus vitellinus TaxID=328815 RepID=UPI00115F5805|nr:WAP four-disulfide core domain protein 3 [Manacus vitellinus]
MAARSPRGSPSLVGSQERQIPDTRVVQARRGSLALPGPWEPPGRPSPPAPPGEELKGRPGGRSAAGSCTMPTARSVLILAGLLALWAELPAASAQNVTNKPGTCPPVSPGIPMLGVCTNQCKSDANCSGNQKCCRNGCESPGYCPRAGSAIGPSCGASCHDDTACHSGEKCCTRGCCTRCVHAEPAKPGFCPRKRTQRSAAACPNRCTDDRDCPGDHKCCFSGCGLACAPPDTGSHHASAKPGTCPMVLRGSLGPCLELCDTDGDCLGDDKCCTTGCGHVCKPPTRVDGNQADKCLLLCLQDKDCPTSQKCCQQGCSRVCIPPLWGTA